MSEDGGSIVLDADDRPAALVGPLQCLPGAAGVIELALAVVMQDEQAKGRLVLMLGEIEHRDVAVRVASRQERPSAGAAPDPDRFLRAIIEIVGLGLMRDRAATVVMLPARRASRSVSPGRQLIGRMPAPQPGWLHLLFHSGRRGRGVQRTPLPETGNLHTTQVD
jgi:hypothetical protein